MVLQAFLRFEPPDTITKTDYRTRPSITAAAVGAGGSRTRRCADGRAPRPASMLAVDVVRIGHRRSAITAGSAR
jgi:hypothetical protein